MTLYWAIYIGLISFLAGGSLFAFIEKRYGKRLEPPAEPKKEEDNGYCDRCLKDYKEGEVATQMTVRIEQGKTPFHGDIEAKVSLCRICTNYILFDGTAIPKQPLFNPLQAQTQQGESRVEQWLGSLDKAIKKD